MKKTLLLVFSFFIFISLIFFNSIFKTYVPFPGDLLVGEYTPYSSYPFLGFSPAAYPNKGQDFDVIRLLFPGKEFSIAQLKKGEIPLWNPYIFAGHPQMASFQWGVFYPINLLFFILPLSSAWAIYIILQPILAAFFTYLLLREYKLSNFASVFGGTVFSFSSFMTVWMLYGNLGHSIVWLPLVLLLIHKLLTKFDVLKSAILVLALTLSILSGYIQTTLYLFIFAFIYAVFLTISENNAQKVKKLFYLSIIFILPAFLSAMQLLPTIELFRNSTRVSYSLETFLNLLIPLKHLVSIIIPDFFGNPATRNYYLSGTYIERVSYIGIIPLFFAIFSLNLRPSKFFLFYVFSLISVFIVLYDTLFTRFLYTIYMPPIISTGVPTRMMFLFCFSLSILSAFGIDKFIKEKSLKKFILTSTIFLILLASIWGFVLFYPAQGELVANLLITKRNLILPSLILLVGICVMFLSLKFKKFTKILQFGVLLLTMADLYFFFQKITPFAPFESMYPQTPVLQKLKQIQGIDRSWGYGSAYIEANIQTVEKIFGTDGYDALHLRSYGELVTASDKGQLANPPPRSEAMIHQGFGTNDLKENKYRQNILNLLGVKFILHKSNLNSQDFETFPKETFELVWADGTFQIYKNLSSLPRYFLTNSFKIEKNKEKRINYLATNDISKTIILEEDIKIASLTANDEGLANLRSYTPHKITFETKSNNEKLLFLSDTYDEGWEGRIDGHYARIYRANQAFRAILVPKGEHTVEFIYSPKSFNLGLKISIVSVILGASFLLFVKLKKLNGSN